MRKRLLTGLVMVIVLVLLVGLNVGLAKTVYLNMGSTSSTSGLYAWAVATASVVNKADNDVRVTVIESGAALDNLRRIKDGAFDFAEQIRKKVFKTQMNLENKKFNFTVSIGTSLINLEQDLNSSINIADKALYRAKNMGRNIVCKAIKSS